MYKLLVNFLEKSFDLDIHTCIPIARFDPICCVHWLSICYKRLQTSTWHQFLVTNEKCFEQSCAELAIDAVSITLTCFSTFKCRLKVDKPSFVKQTIQYGKINSIDMDAFRLDLAAISLMTSYNDFRLQQLTDLYQQELRSLLDVHAPLIIKNISHKHRESWYTEAFTR